MLSVIGLKGRHAEETLLAPGHEPVISRRAVGASDPPCSNRSVIPRIRSSNCSLVSFSLKWSTMMGKANGVKLPGCSSTMRMRAMRCSTAFKRYSSSCKLKASS